MKDKSGDYRDWRYLCEVVRIDDGSEVRALLWHLTPPRASTTHASGAHTVTVCRMIDRLKQVKKHGHKTAAVIANSSSKVLSTIAQMERSSG